LSSPAIAFAAEPTTIPADREVNKRREIDSAMMMPLVGVEGIKQRSTIKGFEASSKSEEQEVSQWRTRKKS